MKYSTSHVAIITLLSLSVFTSACPIQRNAQVTDIATDVLDPVNLAVDPEEYVWSVSDDPMLVGRAKAAKAAPAKAKPPPAPKLPAAKPTPVAKPPAAKPPAAKPPAAKPPPAAKTPAAKPPAKSTSKLSATSTKALTPTATKAAQCAKTRRASRLDEITFTAKRLIQRASYLFKRDNEEFIGYHGTNSDTAAFWTKNGFISKPPANSGLLDFLGITAGTAGTSGADAELGPGLYVSDEIVLAQAAASGNVIKNKGTTPQVCAIFAKSSANWRTAITKVFMPENLVGDSKDATVAARLQSARVKYLTDLKVASKLPVLFSLLDRSLSKSVGSSQLLLPSELTHLFTAKCFASASTTLPEGALPFSKTGFSYNSATFRSEWNIIPENQQLANADCAS